MSRMNGKKTHTAHTHNKKTRKTNKNFVGLEHDALKPRLAMDADVPTDKKTCKRAGDAAAD